MNDRPIVPKIQTDDADLLTLRRNQVGSGVGGVAQKRMDRTSKACHFGHNADLEHIGQIGIHKNVGIGTTIVIGS